mgnify:CR=1 FL=1
MRHLLPNMDFRYYYTNNSLMAKNNFKVIFTFYLVRDSVSHQEQSFFALRIRFLKSRLFLQFV